MIPSLHATYPALSIRRLCALLGVSRTWFSTCPTREERAAREADLRDAIEQLVLEFPGYGYR